MPSMTSLSPMSRPREDKHERLTGSTARLHSAATWIEVTREAGLHRAVREFPKTVRPR